MASTAACDIGGSLTLRLFARGGTVARAEIVSTRPVNAARVFVGEEISAVCARIGQIFSLCGVAQTVAALRAGEAALAITPAAGVEAGRDLARLAEMFTQTAMRLGLHWPRLLGL
ncbi:MAG: hypothetical protein D6801_02755, partial [Alphaproteobacteria bacterium]